MNTAPVQRTILGVIPSAAAGRSRAALLMTLIDRAQHDRDFRTELRHEPVEAAARIGIVLHDEEWAGLRYLLVD